MKTLLSRFCEEFVNTLRPLLTPLGRAADALATAAPDDAVTAVQARLLELRQQMQLLTDKVRDQQAYVLIFGPLKSGKSTLMNAIAGSYVSEVSSLPAYPCMVFVQHDSERSHSATSYDNRVQSFVHTADLESYVARAHQELATRLREVENSGAQFDPREHLTSAIARIDIRTKTEGLERSKAVLVDTPGLYSRMKFGYDQMTREFRNTAASAVFVVRSDNLFLEQVFAEFTDLLSLFSRIFLVVNIDSTKQDLDSGGRLVPSLEQRDPSRIVRAFESLSMTAPLKQAAEQGRVRIYPIDLLRAASARIRRSSDHAAARAAFDRFFGDLTDYLNSTDYMVAFLGDSLRRSGSLLGEAAAVVAHPSIAQLRTATAETAARRATRQAELEAIARLEQFRWEDELAGLGQALTQQFHAVAADVQERTHRGIADAVRDWFRSDASLQHLVKTELCGLLNKHQVALIAAISRELSERLIQNGIGFELGADLRADLETTGIDIAAIGREAHHRTDRAALVAVPPTPLRTEHFELRRTLLDRLLLRGQGALRRHLFGPPDAPGHRILPATKAARLGEEARRGVLLQLTSYERHFFAETADRIVAGFARGFGERVATAIRQQLRDRRSAVEDRIAVLTAQLSNSRRLLEPLDALREQATTTGAAVERLSTHYAKMDLFLLTQPVEPEGAWPERLAEGGAPPAAAAATAPAAARAEPGETPALTVPSLPTADRLVAPSGSAPMPAAAGCRADHVLRPPAKAPASSAAAKAAPARPAPSKPAPAAPRSD